MSVKPLPVLDIVIHLIYYVDLLKKINPDVLLSDLRDLPPGLNYLVLFVKRKKFACFLNPAISNNN